MRAGFFLLARQLRRGGVALCVGGHPLVGMSDGRVIHERFDDDQYPRGDSVLRGLDVHLRSSCFAVVGREDFHAGTAQVLCERFDDEAVVCHLIQARHRMI